MKDFAQYEEVQPVNRCSNQLAIFSGVLAVLMIGLLLGLLGMAMGFSLFSPQKSVVYTLSIGALVWLFFSTIASMYTGGWTAGYFSPKASKNGMLNGFIVSSLSIFIFLVLAFTTVGMVLSSSFSGLQHALSATKENASSIATVLQGVSKFSPKLSEKAKKAIPSLKPITDKINQKVAELLPESDETSAEKVKADLEKIMAHYLNSIESSNYDETKQKLVSTLTEASGKSSEEINQKIDKWKDEYVQAKEQAYQTIAKASKDTAKAISQFALLNFFVLMTAIIAGMLGGAHGVRNRYSD